MAETNNIGQSILTEKNILELIYQNKFNNIVDCLISSNKKVDQYNSIVSENKDTFDTIKINKDEVGQDLFDQNNRLNWFMPEEYKNFDIENYILELAKSPQEKQRVESELDLFK